jgi:hypothetical protein
MDGPRTEWPYFHLSRHRAATEPGRDMATVHYHPKRSPCGASEAFFRGRVGNGASAGGTLFAKGSVNNFQQLTGAPRKPIAATSTIFTGRYMANNPPTT